MQAFIALACSAVALLATGVAGGTTLPDGRWGAVEPMGRWGAEPTPPRWGVLRPSPRQGGVPSPRVAVARRS